MKIADFFLVIALGVVLVPKQSFARHLPPTQQHFRKSNTSSRNPMPAHRSRPHQPMGQRDKFSNAPIR